ncbi:MAG: MFS transporter [Fimbriimonadaceae bacterium]
MSLAGPLPTRLHIGLTIYWFAINFLWGSITVVLLPFQVQKLAPQNPAIVLGLIGGFAAVGALLTPVIAGALSDRCRSRYGRRRPYILLGSVLTVFSLFGMQAAFETGIIWLYATSFFILSVSNNIATGAFSGVMPDLVPHAEYGKNSGYMAMMSTLGLLFGALLAGQTAEMANGWVAIFVIATVQVVTMTITWFSVKEERNTRDVPPLTIKVLFSAFLFQPRKHPDFTKVFISRFSIMLGFYAVTPFLQYYLGDILGVPEPVRVAGYLLAVILVGATVSGYLGGQRSDQIGRRPVVAVAMVLMSLSSLTLILANQLWVALVITVVFGLGFGAYNSVDWAIGAETLPDRSQAARYMGIWQVGITAAQLIGQPFAGVVLTIGGSTMIERYGESVAQYQPLGYAMLFAFAAVTFLVGCTLLLKVRTPAERARLNVQ